MALRRILELALAILMLAAVLSKARGQSNCEGMIASLSPCLNYITGNSSTPSPDCCNQLENVIKTQAKCLCQIINGTVPSIGVQINQTRAFELPGACNLQTPSISQCNATATSPPGASSGSPSTPSGGNSSDGCRIKIPFVDDKLFYVPVIMASFVSILTAIV